MDMFSIHIYNRPGNNFKLKNKTKQKHQVTLLRPCVYQKICELKLSGNPRPERLCQAEKRTLRRSDTNTHRLSPNDEKRRKNTLGGQNASRDEVVRRQDVNIASFPVSVG